MALTPGQFLAVSCLVSLLVIGILMVIVWLIS